MKFRKKRMVLGAWLLAAALTCSACASVSIEGLDDYARGTMKEETGDFEISLSGTDGNEAYDLAEGTCIYGSASHSYVDTLDGENLEKYDQTLSALGVRVGDEMDAVLALPEMQENYAGLQYENDPAGDGNQTINTAVYGGTMIDLEELNCLDCMITFAWYQEGGVWKQMDFSTDDIENHTQVITIAFDIQGPAAEYGVSEGQICGIFCEYH